MNPAEYEVMARVEAEHWWYQGLRDALARVLTSPRLRLPERPKIVDAGCGTGANLAFLCQLLDPVYLGGFDASETALGFAREKAPMAELYVSDICNPELHQRQLDLVVSLDVIYIPGSEKALPGLLRLVDHLRPGGLFVLNLPAYDWLYSEHDVAVHTAERYTSGRVRKLLGELGLQPALVSYRLCALFPAVVLSRLPSLLREQPPPAQARSDLHSVPGPFVNRTLLGVLSLENRLLARGVPLPWGSSVFAVGRKPGGRPA